MILLIYLIIASTHSVVAPLTVGNDEWAHFLYVRFLAEHGRLPVTLAERQEAGYKADAPPLYHLLVAAVTAGVEPARLLRPLDSPRRHLADNVLNPYALVHLGYELPPYQGEVLLWHLGRGLSILFGVVLIGLTYLTSLVLWPQRRRALVAAALVAFMPALIFHSSVLTYESFSAVWCALFLLVSIQAISQPQRWWWWLILGALAGLAITTKYSAILLPVELGLVAGLAWFKQHHGQTNCSGRLARFPLKFILVAGLGLILTAGWWFVFLVWHFNTVDTQGPLIGVLQPLLVGDGSDTTSVALATSLWGEQVVTAEARPPLARNYLQLLQLLLASFWAAPVAGHFILSPWLAILFTLAAIVSVVGLGQVWLRADSTARIWLILLLGHSLLIAPLLVIRIFFSFDPREVAQGRHLLLPAVSAIAILWVWGWSRWKARLGQAVVTGLLLWSLLGQLGWASVVYPPPMPVWVKQAPAAELSNPRPLNYNFVEGMRLSGFSWRELPLSVEVALWWEALAILPADYLIELTLLDQVDRPVSYTVGHPIQGRYPTRAWEPGDIIKDTYWLPLTGSLQGSYHLQLRVLTQAVQPVPKAEAVRLGPITLARPGYPPAAPCSVWWHGQPSLFISALRLRSTLTVISPNLPRLTAPAGENGQPSPAALATVGNLHLFIVEPDWQDYYQLWNGSTRCHDIQFELPQRSFTLPAIPFPLAANFNGQVQLLGYDLPARRIQAGQRLPLTLYWQALAYIGEDYQIFDNLLDSEQRRWGGYDRRPQDGYSTLLWAPGEVITDSFGVPIDPAAPNGIYTLDVGLYRPIEGRAHALPLVENGQPIGQNSVRLGPIKVGGPPSGATIQNPSPQVELNQTLGQQITLLGYDVEQVAGGECQEASANCRVSIRLYWQAEVIPTTDYTTFLHLRNTANETTTQMDSPPAGGRYPTSLWEAGEVIVDERVLPLAGVPPGSYLLVVGLYDRVSGNRLPLPDNPAGEIILEPVEIP